ncbi:hypothetical protein ACFFGT_16485 [Mucilaginibacter angelicae]|uniref:Lipoprotein n=1 Tax=Mucilaginibacter angelicae TaxID=869718 RepID=A0ABV6L8P7_9SPHI
MKTKLFLALLAGVLLLGACGRSSKYEQLREDKASAADTVTVSADSASVEKSPTKLG